LSVARGGAEEEQRELASAQRGSQRAKAQWEEEYEQLESELAAHKVGATEANEEGLRVAATATKALIQQRAEVAASRAQLEEAVAEAIRCEHEEQDRAKAAKRDAARQLFDAQENWFSERSSLERQLAAAQEQVRRNRDEVCEEATKIRTHLEKQAAIWSVQQAALARELQVQENLKEEAPQMQRELLELQEQLAHRREQWQCEKVQLEQRIAASEPQRERNLSLMGQVQAARRELAQRQETWEATIARLQLDSKASEDDMHKSRGALQDSIRAAEQEFEAARKLWRHTSSTHPARRSIGSAEASTDGMDAHAKSPATEPRRCCVMTSTPAHASEAWSKRDCAVPQSASQVVQVRSAGKARLSSPSMKVAVQEACNKLEQLYSPSAVHTTDAQTKLMLGLSTPDVPITMTRTSTGASVPS
jgi:hypothetical protein